MENHEIVEFLFRFNFREHILLEEKNQFFEDFVFLFVEENGWSCGGSYDGIGIYDITSMTKYSEFQTKILEYIRLGYSDIIKSISVGEYDESADEFIYAKNLVV